MNLTSLVRPRDLDYLSGASMDPIGYPLSVITTAPVDIQRRRMSRISAVGFTSKATGLDPASIKPMVGVFAGLAAEHIPVTLQVTGDDSGVCVAMGTWADNLEDVTSQHHVLTSLVEGSYATVDIDPLVPSTNTLRWSQGGLVLGTPGILGKETRQARWDRLLRGLMPGGHFQVTIVAQPIESDTISQLRDIAISDLRSARTVQGARDDPLTDLYVTQLNHLIDTLQRSLSVGAWRTATYLVGDDATYWKLAAAWRSVHATEEAISMPIRVYHWSPAIAMANNWDLPYVAPPPGPRAWNHPFTQQTLLDSTQISALADLPTEEVNGFRVRKVANFAQSRPSPQTTRVINIGSILRDDEKSGVDYVVDANDLTRHLFIAGLTGSGKTNTVMNLLKEVGHANIPFLVIEPAKTEYRELLTDPQIGKSLRVLTAGREQVAPLRINPFEVPRGIDISTHLDLLKSVFKASFAMWLPLPQILEQCLIELYEARGWDFASNARPEPFTPASIPNLGDLVAAVERTVPALGYKEETTQEITAALTTRLKALRRGSRGLMLDVESSMSIEQILESPTIIELEGIGDDADKAFIMGLLLIRLYEHRRASHAQSFSQAAHSGKPAPKTGVLNHLVVFEEAHRLLSKSTKTVDAWHADPQGAFADAFSHMLAEMRAYGQGFIIADQVPARLAPEIIKNTNLKIVHRLVARDDRDVLAATMVMTEDQSESMARLSRGQATVYGEGDHGPVLIAIPKAKDLGVDVAVDDGTIQRVMQGRSPLVQVSTDGWQDSCPNHQVCQWAHRLAETPPALGLMGRVFISSITHPDGLDSVWSDVVNFVSARSDVKSPFTDALAAFTAHGGRVLVFRRGMTLGWSLSDTESLSSSFLNVLNERISCNRRWLGSTESRRQLTTAALRLLQRNRDPYPLCNQICPDHTCRYRSQVQDVLISPRHYKYPTEPADPTDPGTYMLAVASYVGNDVVIMNDQAPTGATSLQSARWQAIGCAGQVKFCVDEQPTQTANTFLNAMIAAGWHPAAANPEA